MSDTLKILLINGSPRKERSASLRIAKKFIEGLCMERSSEVEQINVSDLKVTPCHGCLCCWGRNEGECVIKNDDIPMVKEKILQADLIVLSTPLYFFGMPGEMKVVIDRLLSMMKTYKGQSAIPGQSFHGLRYDLSDKKIVVVSSCGYAKLDYIYDAFLTQIDCVLGKDNYLALLCPQGNCMTFVDLYDKMEKYLVKYIEAGKEYAETFSLSEETILKLQKPPFTERTFQILLNQYWESEKEAARAFVEEEPS